MKESAFHFFLDVLSVILGIVITFAIQGLIDRSRDRKNVRSAMELVRTELATNIEDINVMHDYLLEANRSALYFLQHSEELDACPEDSIEYHGSVLLAEVSLTTSSDALELLKSSSLFQKIGDNALSMKIIRAYDCCGNIVSGLNRHLANRSRQFEESINGETVGIFASKDGLPFREYLKTDYGIYTVRWIASQTGQFTDTSEIREAIDAIDAYLK